MAIAFAGMRCIQRSQGQSSVAASAYRSASRLRDVRTGQVADYAGKQGVAHRDILLPEGANPEFAQREVLWNAVEAAERRRDALVARECILALPANADITLDQQVELAERFAQHHFVSHGYVVDMAIHTDNPTNPHAHLLITPRKVDGQGFAAKKTYELAPQLGKGGWQGGINWGESWRAHQNEYFKAHALAITVDPNGLVAQVHLGKRVTHAAYREELDHFQDYQDRRALNAELAQTDPAQVLQALAKYRTEFTQHDIERYVNKLVPEAADYPSALEGVLASTWLKPVGINPAGERTYRVLRPGEMAVSDNTVPAPMQRGKPAVIDLTHPANIANQLTLQHAVFSEVDIAKHVHGLVDDPQQFEKIRLAVLQSPALIPLGAGDDGRQRYTTPAMWQVECQLQTDATVLAKRNQHRVPAKRVKQLAKRKGLNAGQTQALQHLLKGQAMSCVVGLAGAGKSYLLGAARLGWQAQGYQAVGVALAGKAAESLTQESGIPSMTIDAFLLKMKGSQAGQGSGAAPPVLDKKTVLVLDEAGMVDNVKLAKVVAHVKQAKAKLVLVGDPAQLQPIGPGAPFRALLEQVGFAELNTIRRQTHAWQRMATQAFARGHVAKALQAYGQRGYIHWGETQTTASRQLIDQWQQDKQCHPKESQLILAFRRNEVDNLNQLARQARIAAGDIDPGQPITTAAGTLTLSVGDRVLLTQNNRSLGVKNGQLGGVQAIDAAGQMTLAIDGRKTPITFNVNDYPHISLGYATTVHKSQGMTVDRTYVLTSKVGWNQPLAYVAGSRHRESLQLYASKADFADDRALSRTLSRPAIKDSAFNYPLGFALRRGLDSPGLWAAVKTWVLARLQGVYQSLVNWVSQAPSDKPIAQSVAECAQQCSQTQPSQRTQANDPASPAANVAAFARYRQQAAKLWQEIKTYAAGQATNVVSAQAYRQAQQTAIHQHPDYAHWQGLAQQRDKLAASLLPHIQQQPSRFTNALAAQRLTPETLAYFAERHQARQRVQAYQAAVNDKQVLTAGALASRLLQAPKANKAAIQQANIPWRELSNRAKLYHQRQQQVKRAPAQRELTQCAQAYRDTQQACAKAWQRYARAKGQFESAAQTGRQASNYQQLAALLNIAKTWTTRRNQQAWQLVRHSAYQAKVVGGLSINHQLVSKHASQQFNTLKGDLRQTEQAGQWDKMLVLAITLKQYAEHRQDTRHIDYYGIKATAAAYHLNQHETLCQQVVATNPVLYNIAQDCLRDTPYAKAKIPVGPSGHVSPQRTPEDIQQCMAAQAPRAQAAYDKGEWVQAFNQFSELHTLATELGDKQKVFYYEVKTKAAAFNITRDKQLSQQIAQQPKLHQRVKAALQEKSRGRGIGIDC